MSKRRKKRTEETRMDDLIPLDLNASTAVEDEDLQIHDVDFDEVFAMKVKQHNFNIREFHEDYVNFVPNGYAMLVRPFLKEIKFTEDGVVIPNREVIGIPTKQGPGGASHYETITDPFGFSRKAVVVSVSNESTMKAKYQPGDIVYLGDIIKALPMGKGGDVTVHVPSSFVHPVSGPDIPPTDPSDPHFGYMIAYEQDIKGTDRRDNLRKSQPEENKSLPEGRD